MIIVIINSDKLVKTVVNSCSITHNIFLKDREIIL